MHQNLLSFNSGELSPYLAHRVDFAKHAAGSARMENFLPMAYGAFQKRPGTRRLGAALRQLLIQQSPSDPVQGSPGVTYGSGTSAVSYALQTAVPTATVAHASGTTTAPVSGVAVISPGVAVTISSRGRMTISGLAQDGAGNADTWPVLYYAGTKVTGPYSDDIWSSDGHQTAPATGAWHCAMRRASSGLNSCIVSRSFNGVETLTIFQAGAAGLYPPDITWVSATFPVGGLSSPFTLPTCAWADACAAQVAAAVNASSAAAALVVASIGSDGSGAASKNHGPTVLVAGTQAGYLGQLLRVGAGGGPWNVWHCTQLYPVVWTLTASGVSEADMVAGIPGFVTTFFDRHEALLPFVAAAGEKYLLHFLPGWLEVLAADGSRKAVLRWLTDYAWPADQHPAQVQLVQLNDVAFISHPAHAPIQLSRRGDADWTLDWLAFTAAPCLDDNSDSARTYSMVSNPRPDTWSSGKTYAAGDRCFDKSEWVCTNAHTSDSSVQPGVGTLWKGVWKRRLFAKGEPVTLICDDRQDVEWSRLFHPYNAGTVIRGGSMPTAPWSICIHNTLGADSGPGGSDAPASGDWQWIVTYDTSSPTAVPSGAYRTSAGTDNGLYHFKGVAHVPLYSGRRPGLDPSWPLDWDLVGGVDLSAIDIPNYQISDWYAPGDEVSRAGKLYRCLYRHQPTASNEPGGSGTWTGCWQRIDVFAATTAMGLRGPGTYYRIAPERSQFEAQVELAALVSTDGHLSPEIVMQGAWDFFTFGTWHGTFTLERSADGGTTWAVDRSWQASGDRNVADSGTEDEPVLLRLGFTKQSTTETTGEQRAVLIPRLTRVTGYALLTEYVSATEMRGMAVTSLLSGSTWRWAAGAFTDANGYPAAVCLHERRLFFAGSAANPVSLWGSATDDLNHFETGTKDSDGIFVTLAANASEPIRWMASQRSLFLGTPMGEWTCGTDPAYMAYTAPAALTPTNFQCRQYTAFGSSTLQPIKVAGSLIFAGRNGSRLWELSFSNNGSAGGDLSAYAEHLTAKGIVSLARQAVRTPGLWAVTTDGTLLNLCHDSAESLLAWSRHTTANGRFLAVAVLPANTGDDGVFFLVERGAATWLEAIPQGWQAAREAGTPDPVLDSWYVDGGTNYGETVTSTLTTLPLDVQDPQTGQATASRVKRAQEMILNLLASQGGSAVNDGTECPLDYAGIQPFSGWLRVTLPPAHVTDLQPSIVHATADPFTCLAAVVSWEPSEP